MTKTQSTTHSHVFSISEDPAEDQGYGYYQKSGRRFIIDCLKAGFIQEKDLKVILAMELMLSYRSGFCATSRKEVAEILGGSLRRISPSFKRLIDAGILVIVTPVIERRRIDYYTFNPNISFAGSKKIQGYIKKLIQEKNIQPDEKDIQENAFNSL